MDLEKYRGLGRQNRRLMIKLWKASGSPLSLRQWAAQAQVGDLAHVWIHAKRGK